MLTANIFPVRPMPDCTSSAIKRIPCRLEIRFNSSKKLRGRHDVAPFSLDGFEDNASNLIRAEDSS
jgi:hypothetical protein